MVLGAGLGTRLRPITEEMPKPLVPVLAKPLIEQAFANLAEAGVREAIVNAHYLSEQMQRWLHLRPIFGLRATVSLEKDRILGTGGGIKKARWFLEKSDPFVVLNGDTLSRPDLRSAIETHRSSGALATLVLKDDPRMARFGAVSCDEDGAVTDIAGRVGREGARRGLFIGAHVLSRVIFDRMPDADVFCIVNDVYAPLLRAGETRIRAVFTERPFFDLGTLSDYAEAQFELIREGLRDFPHFFTGLVQRKRHVFLSPSAKIDPSASLVGPCAVCAGATVGARAQVGPGAVVGERVVVEAGARVTRSVLMPGARTEADETLVNVVRTASLEATIPRSREPLIDG
jgi:NDP-sugar pyrophosphorylase family protein